MTRTYSELSRLYTFEERYEYLKMDGEVGQSTFGFDRYVNQKFYTSYEWRYIRHHVIFRDNGCDLGIPGYDIYTDVLIHHMNPVSIDDIVHRESWILNPEYLITTTQRTHNAIHYGRENLYPEVVTARTPNDTKLW
jgi:hypothetical protein